MKYERGWCKNCQTEFLPANPWKSANLPFNNCSLCQEKLQIDWLQLKTIDHLGNQNVNRNNGK